MTSPAEDVVWRVLAQLDLTEEQTAAALVIVHEELRRLPGDQVAGGERKWSR